MGLVDESAEMASTRIALSHERAARRASSPSAPPEPGSGGTTVASASDALEQGALNRLRVYRLTMIAWCVVGLGASTFIPGKLHDRVVCAVSVAVFLGSYFLADGKGASEVATGRIGRMFPVAVVQALGAMGVCVGLGLASPCNGLLVMALILYAMSAPTRDARAIFVLVAGAYALLSALVLAGALPGTGLLTPLAVPWGTKLANAVWVEATYVTGFLVGRFARRDSARIARELERVVRQSAHREALLREAREELARAAAVGGRGPFTDVELEGFRLGCVIGRGGMGEVYAATREGGAEGDTAVKLLRRDVLADPEIVRRFERESRIVRSLQSPHIVTVLAVGGSAAPLPYIAMERLRGEDLVAVLRARATLEMDAVATLVRHVCAGLEVAHAAGVVHRDLKPANLFRCAGPRDGAPFCWKVLDFGVSKLIDVAGSTLTTSEVLGTPHYMAPEQAARRRDVDGRADLYSVGVVAYRALTGRLAFPKYDMSEVLSAVMTEMPEDPRSLRMMHDDVAHWLRIALAKRPADRFARASAMAEALDDAIAGRLSPELRARAIDLSRQLPWAGPLPAQAPRASAAWVAAVRA